MAKETSTSAARHLVRTLQISSGDGGAPSSVPAGDSSGILCCSVSHAPKSIKRQRSLQKGRYADSGDQGTGRRH